MSYRSGRNRRARAGVVSLVLSAALLPPLSGCSDAGPTSPSQFVASSLSLILPPEIEEGQTVQASLGAGGEGAIWVTSDPTVATVDGRGMIRGKKAGEVQILAAKGGNSANARLKVNGMKVEISPDSATIASVGGTAQLEALVTYKDGTPVQNPDLQWSSTNDGIATVDGGGKVVGRAVGLALIAVLSSGRSDTVPVRIGQAAVASVAVAPSSATLDVGKAVQLSATVRDTEGNLVPSARVLWTSSNSAAAVVDATGGVTALAGGSATVTATFQGKSGSAQIKVNAPASAPASPPPSGIGSKFPNQPAEFTTITSYSMDVAPPYDGWGGTGALDIVTDPSAPASAANVGRVRFEAGIDGWSPISIGRDFTGSEQTSEIYVGFWIKLDPNWVNHAVGSKLFYLDVNSPSWPGGASLYAAFDGSNMNLLVNQQNMPWGNKNWYPNRGSAQRSLANYRGKWVLLEYYFKLNTGSNANGIIRAWMTVDGVTEQIHDHADVKFIDEGLGDGRGWKALRWHPVYGGVGSPAPRDMYQYVDQIQVSGNR